MPIDLGDRTQTTSPGMLVGQLAPGNVVLTDP